MQLSYDLPSRFARLVLTVLMALTWSGAMTVRSQAAAAPQDRKAIVDSLDRILQALEAADKEDGRDGYDVKAMAEKIGLDPVKLFQWVRDQTYWVPYRGALRGPTGVLMDRLGNSLDRSLLLAEMLRAKGDKVRLVHASLTVEQAKDLLATVRPVPKNRLAAIEEPSDDQVNARLEDYAKRFSLDANALKTASERDALQGARITEAMAGRVSEQVEPVAATLANSEAKEDAGAAIPGAPDKIAAAQDHWWIQRDDNGTWVDLDPMLPDASPGKHLSDVQGEPREYDGKLPADASLSHEVLIEVTIERWTAGKLSEATILKQTLRPIEVLGKRLALSHLPTSWPDDVDLLKSKDAGQTIRELASQQHEWAPLLTIGSENVIQSSFDDAGRVNASPKLSPMAKTGASANAASDDARSALAPEPPKPADDGVLTAEWIDYQIDSPGRPSTKIRRELFDILGPAARAAAGSSANVAKPPISDQQAINRSLSTLGETEILLQPCEMSQAFFRHIKSQGVLANRAPLLAVAGNSSPDIAFANEILKQLVVPPGQVYELALERAECSPVRGDVYLDRPNILSQHRFLTEDNKQQLLQCDGFDIVMNEVAVRDDIPGGAPAVKKTRLRQGVTDTVAEAVLASGCGNVENTSELLAASATAGEQWLTVRDKKQLANLLLPKDVAARIEQDITGGCIVMVPKKPIEIDGRSLISWWRVNPTTGQTLGIGHQGWGATMEEEIITISRIAVKAGIMYACIGKLVGGTDSERAGGAVLCFLVGAVGIVGLVQGGAAGSIIALAADLISYYKTRK